MPEIRTVLDRARARRRIDLETRVAELTDLVADLLVPLAQHDQAAVDEIVGRYRASI